AASAAVDAGLEALDGAPGGMRDGLIYAGASILWHRGKVADLRAGADAVRGVLDDGSAKARFVAARG
ncbi:MAG: anthranilate phosphoribosyltransferase, partial [Gammaproteobacteria bacterium]